MEVHPPEHGIHSWRDFFVHMGTIVLGLLIAIGLEQSVEAWHRHHELHKLREDLRVEEEQNLKRSEDLVHRQQKIFWVTLLTLSRAHGAISAHQALPSDLDTGTLKWEATLPADPVWSAAVQGRMVEILPREDTEVYSELDRLIKKVAEDDKSEVVKDGLAFNARRGQDYARFRTEPDLQNETLKLMSDSYAASYFKFLDLAVLYVAEQAAVAGKPLDKVLEAENDPFSSLLWQPERKKTERPADPNENAWLARSAATPAANLSGTYESDSEEPAYSRPGQTMKPTLTIRQNAIRIHIERTYEYGSEVTDTKLDGSLGFFTTPAGLDGTAQARIEGSILIVRLEILHSTITGDYYEYVTRRYQLTPDRKQLKVHIDHLYPPMAAESFRETSSDQMYLRENQ